MIKKRIVIIWLLAMITILFGIMTIKSGSAVLFIDGEARIAAGNYVGFVLWFNFIAGFFYIIAGLGFLFDKKWTVKLAFTIAISTLLIFAAFGMHIIMEGGFEIRTVIAMSLRSVIWIGLTFAAIHLAKKTKY